MHKACTLPLHGEPLTASYIELGCVALAYDHSQSERTNTQRRTAKPSTVTSCEPSCSSHAPALLCSVAMRTPRTIGPATSDEWNAIEGWQHRATLTRILLDPSFCHTFVLLHHQEDIPASGARQILSGRLDDPNSSARLHSVSRTRSFEALSQRSVVSVYGCAVKLLCPRHCIQCASPM